MAPRKTTTPTTPPYFYLMNCMELIIIYTSSWHRAGAARTRHPRQLHMGNNFVLYSLRPSYYEFVNGIKRMVHNINTSEDHDKASERHAPTDDMADDMNTYWPSLGEDAERFQREQYNKHMKYFHSQPVFENVNMWSVGLEFGKMFLSVNGEHYLNNIIFSRYKVGDVIGCGDFVNFLSDAIGYSVKVSFWWPTDGNGPGYLRQISILFELDRSKTILDYNPEKNGYGKQSKFVLEGAPGVWPPPPPQPHAEPAGRNRLVQSRRKKHFFWGCINPFGLISRLCRK